MSRRLPLVVVLGSDHQAGHRWRLRAGRAGRRPGDAFFRIGHAQNSGAVFGIMKGSGDFFTVFSIVAAAADRRGDLPCPQAPARSRSALGLVLGGAVGNLIDRLRLGAVVDFIDIGVNDRIRWPSFNVADLAITVGSSC